jgi:hypothetical protein
MSGFHVVKRDSDGIQIESPDGGHHNFTIVETEDGRRYLSEEGKPARGSAEKARRFAEGEARKAGLID